MSLAPEAWKAAAHRLQPAPPPRAAESFLRLPSPRLLKALATAHAQLVRHPSMGASGSNSEGPPMPCVTPWWGTRFTYDVHRNLDSRNHGVPRCHVCAFRRDRDMPGACRLSSALGAAATRLGRAMVQRTTLYGRAVPAIP